MPGCLVGCATAHRSYGDSSVGERWSILRAGDPELEKMRAGLPRQHGYGWAVQVAEYTFDGGPSDLFVGPFAYAGDDPRNLDVSYAVFADPPLAGRLVFEAVATPPYRLPPEWAVGVERSVRMDQKYLFGEVTVPQLTVPTDSLTIHWITEGPAEQRQQ